MVRLDIFWLLHCFLELRDPLLLTRRQLPLRIEPLQYRQPARQMLALILRPCLGNLPRAHHEVRLPNYVVGIMLAKRLCNLKSVLLGFEGSVAVASVGPDIADLVIAH